MNGIMFQKIVKSCGVYMEVTKLPFQRAKTDAKLYWRIKVDGKWKWVAAREMYRGGYAIMVHYYED